MRAVVLALALATFSVPAAAQDASTAAPGEPADTEPADTEPADSGATAEPTDGEPTDGGATASEPAADRAALVLVIDVGRARINPERLLRTVEGTLGRVVVRITDPRAAAAAGTLTVAHESRGRWLVRFDATGGSTSTVAEITRPGLYDVTLAQAARQLVAELETAPSSAPTTPPAATSRPALPSAAAQPSADHLYLSWAEEILDPFASIPSPPPRRERATSSEVLDPFAPVAVRHVTFSEVLDPWGR